MNEIAFVIAPDEFGVGPAIAVEPVVDGVSLVDRYGQVDGERAYAGLRGPAQWLDQWRDAFATGTATEMQFLGCDCGDSACSWATAQVNVGERTVVWSDLRGSDRAGASGSVRYPELGPYRFDRAQYAAALASPQQSEAPVRRRHDPAALRAAIPGEPGAWLKAMTLTFGRDFWWAPEPESTREVAARGLRALSESGAPMTDDVVRQWARERRYGEKAVDRCIEEFRRLAGGP